jgi:hypothetical protein
MQNRLQSGHVMPNFLAANTECFLSRQNYTASLQKSPGRTKTIVTAIVGPSSTRG